MGKNDFTLFACLSFHHSSDVSFQNPLTCVLQLILLVDHKILIVISLTIIMVVRVSDRFPIFIASKFLHAFLFHEHRFLTQLSDLCAHSLQSGASSQPSGSRLGPFRTMPVSCIRHKGTHPGGDLGRGDNDGDLCCHCYCCGENQPPRGPPSGKEVMTHNVLGTTSSSARN